MSRTSIRPHLVPRDADGTPRMGNISGHIRVRPSRARTWCIKIASELRRRKLKSRLDVLLRLMNMHRDLTPISRIDELERMLTESRIRPLLLFKHSYTCGISAEALDEVRAHIEEQASGARYAMVTVQTHRDVSNAIASRLGVRHETPQAILVRNGRAVWNASHFRVTASEVAKAIQASSV